GPCQYPSPPKPLKQSTTHALGWKIWEGVTWQNQPKIRLFLMPADEQPDTIVAISTPPGRGGIGIVRLSGPEARSIAEPLLKLRHPLAPGHARFAEVIDNTGEKPGTVLDEAVVTWFPKPHSYTSEDIVEIA